MGDFIVYPKRMRVLLLAFISFMVMWTGIILFLFSFHVIEHDRYALQGIGIILIGMYGIPFLHHMKVFFARKPAVIINGDGIIDQSSYIGAGLVSWSDIKDITFVRSFGIVYLGIITFDPEYMIKRTTGLKKILNKANKHRKTQIHISIKSLSCTAEELVEEIDLRWKNANKSMKYKLYSDLQVRQK